MSNIALVTGGTSGLGRAIAIKLATDGSDVVLNYLSDHQGAERAKRDVEKVGRQAFLIPGNLAVPKNIVALFAQVKRNFGSLNVFVHSAALGSFRNIRDISPSSWDLTMAVNTRAFLLGAREAIPLMRHKGGAILGVSSLGSIRCVPSYGCIGVSKAALEATIRYLAVECSPLGIRVNGISSGPVETESFRKLPNYRTLAKQFARRTPFGRLGSVEEVASVAAFLCGDQSRWIQGQTIIVDGGLSLI